MLEPKVFDAVNKPDAFEKKQIIDFLFDHLEQYGDPKKHIQKAIDYAIKEFASFGGFVLLLQDEDEITRKRGIHPAF